MVLMQNITDDPKYDPNCCLSLSTRLFSVIKDIAVQRVRLQSSDDTFVFLSVGCGTGFFENAFSMYLQQECSLNARVEGVETQSTMIPFLSNELIHRTKGTWDILDDINGAHVLLFIYPREGRLVQRYLDRFHDHTVAIAIWLGPLADWAEHEPTLQNTKYFGNHEYWTAILGSCPTKLQWSSRKAEYAGTGALRVTTLCIRRHGMESAE